MIRSRKFIVASVGVAVSVAVSLIPELKGMQEEILTIVGAFALAVIGGITVEDAVEKSRGATVPTDITSGLEDLVKTIFDELAKRPELLDTIPKPAPTPLSPNGEADAVG